MKRRTKESLGHSIIVYHAKDYQKYMRQVLTPNGYSVMVATMFARQGTKSVVLGDYFLLYVDQQLRLLPLSYFFLYIYGHN